MPTVYEAGAGWRLRPALAADLDALMLWFDSEAAVRLWAGPTFRYPFVRSAFRKDCHWPEMASFVLCNPEGERSAFGQYYPYRQCLHLARLVVRPAARGHGTGKRFIASLVETGRAELGLDVASLFVYRHNRAAIACYRAMGFEIAGFPPDRAEFREECHYMTLGAR